MSLPPVTDPFYWRDESWGPALRCRALDPLVEHCFTTRGLPIAEPAAAARVAATMGVPGDAVVAARQMHGREVVVVRKGYAPQGPAADGEFTADVLVSNDPGRAVLVRAADCAPILVADRRTGAVAAVHAGWRGTCAGAAPAAVAALGREWGSRPEDLVAAIGPAIGPCCYEVGTELVDAFAAAGHPRHLIDRWFQAYPPARGDAHVAPLRLDVAGANRDQLEMAGVPAGQVHVAGLCTAEYLGVLTSYRAEKSGAGRLAGVIRARPAEQAA